MLEYQQRVTDGSSSVEVAGTTTSPEWNANAALTWSRSGLTVGWRTRYLDSYWLNSEHETNPIQGAAAVGSSSYHDIFGSYRFPAPGDSGFDVFSNVTLRAGVNNVFNKEPRFSVAGAFYGDPWVGPRMASYYFSLSKAF
jgi:iron complex outermembrane recepter protein